MVGKWLEWITSNDLSKSYIIDYAAGKIRETPNAILPLAQHLEQEIRFALETDNAANSSINRIDTFDKQHETTASKNGAPAEEADATSKNSGARGKESVFSRVVDTLGWKSEEPESKAWLREQVLSELKQLEIMPDDKSIEYLVNRAWEKLGENGQASLRQIAKNLQEQGGDEGQLSEEVQAFVEATVKDKQLKVHRQIARLLADMSELVTEDNKNGLEKVAAKLGKNADALKTQFRTDLQTYAVRKLGPRLTREPDPEIRNNLAILLANVGGPQAVDALARAVVGQEQTRANRQKLLAQYYLDPSREQSKQASKILDEANIQAKRTLTVLQVLNMIVFAVGIIILLAGLYLTFTTNGNTRIAGAVDSVGGLAAIIAMLVRDPLNRIQNAMSKLVQVETAFTSFIWELNLNSTYIQSQYVADGILTTSDVALTVKRIEEAMRLTMTQVASHTEEGRQLLIPHLTKISPVVGKLDTKISMYGVNLKRVTDEKDGGVHVLTVAINHIPVLTKDISRDKGEFKIDLPKKDAFPQGLSVESTIWISLIVDGMETNALPYQIIPEKTPGNDKSRAEDVKKD